ncbi:hypothetical protein SMICM17S_11376 [Streptomyces microflavus]
MISKDARPMTDAERRRLIRLLFGPRKEITQGGGEGE